MGKMHHWPKQSSRFSVDLCDFSFAFVGNRSESEQRPILMFKPGAGVFWELLPLVDGGQSTPE